MAPNTYPTRQLGKNGPFVSAIGFGAMGIGAFYGVSDEKAVMDTLTFAADRGITFWDTSDIYGISEEVLGKWFAATGRRSEIFLATKFGAMDFTPGAADPWKPNNKPSYIRRQLAASLKALQTDHIDLYYQHRIDPEVPVEIVMEAFREPLENGQIKYVGISECTEDVLRRAKAVKGVSEKLIAIQMEYSPFELSIEKNGLVNATKELGVAVVAYSPLCRGLVSGKYRKRSDFTEDDYRLGLPRFSEENFPKNIELVDKFQAIADRLNATPSQVALAWILAEHPHFFPIPGTRSVGRLDENAKGAELKLTDEDVKELRQFAEAADVQVLGTRYGQEHLSHTMGSCIPLSEWKGEKA